MDEENYTVANECFSFALLYCPVKNITLLSTLYASRAESNYRLKRTIEARKDITKSRKIEPALVKVCIRAYLHGTTVCDKPMRGLRHNLGPFTCAQHFHS